jgi:hypothetical protein
MSIWAEAKSGSHLAHPGGRVPPPARQMSEGSDEIHTRLVQVRKAGDPVGDEVPITLRLLAVVRRWSRGADGCLYG